MTKKLYRLDDHPEHREQLGAWAAKWIANAMSTKAMDDDEKLICREAVKGLYRAAGLEPPPDHRIVFAPSPFVLRFAGGFAAAIWYMRNKNCYPDGATSAATADVSRFATDRATAASIIDELSRATIKAAENAFIDGTDAAIAIGRSTKLAINTATSDATTKATDRATRFAIDAEIHDASYLATRSAIRDETYRPNMIGTIATNSAFRTATDRAAVIAKTNKNSSWFTFDIQSIVDLANDLKLSKFGLDCAISAYNMWQGGNQWSAWDSFLTFFRHVAKLPLDYSKYDHWEQLALHSGPRIMHPEFCMISDRPEVLLVDEANRPHCDNGPFCKWRDGTALYAIHGTWTPQFVVEHPETITLKDIEKETNVEARRIMIQRYPGGQAKWLRDSDAKLIDEASDLHTGLPLRLWSKERKSDTPIVMIEMQNKTTEPDGSRKPYFIRVRPDITIHSPDCWPDWRVLSRCLTSNYCGIPWNSSWRRVPELDFRSRSPYPNRSVSRPQSLGRPLGQRVAARWLPDLGMAAGQRPLHPHTELDCRCY